MFRKPDKLLRSAEHAGRGCPGHACALAAVAAVAAVDLAQHIIVLASRGRRVRRLRGTYLLDS